MGKILVVDDSAVDRRLAGSLLEKHFAEDGQTAIVYANHGKDAMAVIETELPDLVVTDLQMPEMNGLELVEAIKKKHPGLPVILMTAHGSEEIAIQALEAGAASYVPKRKLASDLVSTASDIIGLGVARRDRQRLLDDCWVQTESHFLLSNDLSHIPALISHLQENLTRMRVCGSNDLVRVGVALREALSNAMIHGNLEVDSALRDTNEKAYYASIEERRKLEPYRNRSVTVIAEESRAEAVYVVRDEGHGFDVANLPDPTDPENLDRVSGRGLFLIRTFMTDVQFNAKGNEITMIKRRD